MKPELTPQILGMYIGQKVEVTRMGDYPFPDNKTIDTLDTVGQDVATFKNSPDWWFGENNETVIKPVLRPLSDMTEEERVDLFYIIHDPELKNKIESLSFDNITKEGFAIKCSQKSNGSMRFYIDFNKLNTKRFLFLLSRGFDLLGLIPAGLAFDATTLKNDKA